MTPAAKRGQAPQALLDLLVAHGPSGYETPAAEVWLKAAGAFAEVSADVLGTPLARVAPKHGAAQPPRRPANWPRFIERTFCRTRSRSADALVAPMGRF